MRRSGDDENKANETWLVHVSRLGRDEAWRGLVINICMSLMCRIWSEGCVHQLFTNSWWVLQNFIEHQFNVWKLLIPLKISDHVIRCMYFVSAVHSCQTNHKIWKKRHRNFQTCTETQSEKGTDRRKNRLQHRFMPPVCCRAGLNPVDHVLADYKPSAYGILAFRKKTHPLYVASDDLFSAVLKLFGGRKRSLGWSCMGSIQAAFARKYLRCTGCWSYITLHVVEAVVPIT